MSAISTGFEADRFDIKPVKRNLTSSVQVLLLQRNKSEDSMAPANRLRHHPLGQASNAEAKYGTKRGLREIAKSAEKVCKQSL